MENNKPLETWEESLESLHTIANKISYFPNQEKLNFKGNRRNYGKTTE